ncbi:hypothetical protein D3C80_1957600 [compost metagenome]
MGGPTGVSNTQTTDERFFGQSLLQLADLARATTTLELFIIGIDRHTGAVIPTVFQTLQAFDQDGGDVTFCDCPDNATHTISPD